MTSVAQSLQGVALPLELDLAPQGIYMPQVFVKPQHLTYLRDFRTQQCPLFANHKCSQHKPFTCFHWHFPNQRRRRPLRKLDGTFSYSPDVYCDKYDETRGECPNGDACPYLHRNAGDTERRYHLRYFKTGTCIHDTDIKGHCSRNGAHCAFAHGATDLRVPVYDIREVQEASDCPINLPASLEKERVLSEDPKWNDMAYVLANYKTEPCRKPPRMCRQGYACPFYHNSKDKRRPPQRYKYRSTPCPGVKSSDEWLDSSLCEAGDDCQGCHTRTEQQFHPEIYKSTKCNDVMQQHYCPRGPFCAFAHDEAEMNFGRNFIQDIEFQGIISAAVAQHQSSSSPISPLALAHLISPTLWERSPGSTAIKGRTASGLSSTSLESGLGSWRHADSPSHPAATPGGNAAAAAAGAAAASSAAFLPDLDDFDLSQGSSGSGGGAGCCGGGGSGCSPLTVQTIIGGAYTSPQQQSPAMQTLFECDQRARAGSGCSVDYQRRQLPLVPRRQPPSSSDCSTSGAGCGSGGYAQSPILMSDSPFSNAGVELERLRYECEIERAQAEARRSREAAQKAVRERQAAEAEVRRLCSRIQEAARLADCLGSAAGCCTVKDLEVFKESLRDLLAMQNQTQSTAHESGDATPSQLQLQSPSPQQFQAACASGCSDSDAPGAATVGQQVPTKFCFAREEEVEQRVEEKR